jgi:hypothetical protein
MKVRAPRFACIATLAAASLASAQPAFNSNCIPPLDGSYVGQFHSWGGGLFNLSDPVHSAFTNCSLPPTGGGTQNHVFSSTVSGTISGPSLPPTFVSLPGANSAVRVTHTGDVGPTSFFDTEMLQLDITGPGILIRESPTLPSLGATSITDLGGGMWTIDSFFDVFTELSIDGGQSWVPSDGPTRMRLVPTPGSISLIAGAILLTAMPRRRG